MLMQIVIGIKKKKQPPHKLGIILAEFIKKITTSIVEC